MSGKVMSQLFAIQLTDAQLLVGLALADHAKEDGSDVWPSVALIAWKVGKSTRQVRRIMRQLEELGVLELVTSAHRHHPARYRINSTSGTAKAPREGGHPDVPPKDGRGDIAMSLEGGHSYDRQGGHPDVPLTVKEPPIEVSSQRAEASPLPPEARPKVALDGAFRKWATELRPGSNVTLTDARAKAYLSRRRHDRFTDQQLLQVIDGAAAAIDDEILDYPHRDTEFYRLFIDASHVEAWITYEETGDFYVISEMLSTEEAA